MTTTVEIRDDGPLGGSYPVATLQYARDPEVFCTRRYGSWLVDSGTGLREPEACGLDAMDLQALPEVKRFDAAKRKAQLDAVAAASSDTATL